MGKIIDSKQHKQTKTLPQATFSYYSLSISIVDMVLLELSKILKCCFL